MSHSTSSSASPSTPAHSASNGPLTFLKVAAVLTALMSIVSPLLALGPLTATGELHAMHGMVGNINAALALVSLVAAFLWGRASGRKGLIGHAAAVLVLAVVQIALGETGQTMVHMVLGFVYLIAAVGLGTMALRQRPATTASATR